MNIRKKRLTVLDCDPGTDDAAALMIACKVTGAPDAAVATYGNAPLRFTGRNLLLLRKYLGAEFGVYTGTEKPEGGEEPSCGGFHGSDGFAGLGDILSRRYASPVPDGDLAAFARLLKSAGEIVYIATGPLTTLAYLLRDGEIRGKLVHAYIMGGGFQMTNMPHRTEYNFYGDPAAVKTVLESGIPVTLFPLDVTHTTCVCAEEIGRLAGSGKYPEMTVLLRRNLRSNTEAGAPGAVLHDTLPVICASDETLFTFRSLQVSCDGYGAIREEKSGYTVRVALTAAEGVVARLLERAYCC